MKIYLILVVVVAAIITGCNKEKNKKSGDDIIFLEAPGPEAPKNTQVLLPMKLGNSWEMLSSGNDKLHKDTIVVNSLVNIDNRKGYLLQLQCRFHIHLGSGEISP